MVKLSATRFSYIAVLRVSLVSFADITFCIASQQVFIVVVYFVIEPVRKLLNTHSYSSLEDETYGRTEGEKRSYNCAFILYTLSNRKH
jgi:hypothetical protein